ncbi:MAG: hypothetical protein AAF639_12145 [Chloroflexota bacterium]
MFIRDKDFAHAQTNLHRQPWLGYHQALTKLVDVLVDVPPSRVHKHAHASVLIQARLFSRAVVSLAGYFRLTNDPKYAEKAWALIEDGLTWPQWYVTNPYSNGFNLATGEIAVSLALSLTFLNAWLSPQNRQMVVDAALERIVQPYLRLCCPEAPDVKPVGWYTRTNNWNAVCNGGMLVLALTLADELEEAARAVPIALEGLQYFLDTLHPDGSSKEGIGYWQYGIGYLTYALLAYEAKTGQPHPAFDSPTLTSGLCFPFDFSPDGVGLSFGDGNRLTSNLGALLPLAQRTGQPQIIAEVNERFFRSKEAKNPLPIHEHSRFTELLGVLYTAPIEIDVKPKPAMQVFPDNGWLLFRRKDITLSFRAGTTDVPHSHRDLNSIQVAKGGVRLVENLENRPYPAGWFWTKEHHFEDQTGSKSGMMINGVGQLKRASATWGYDAEKIWSDAASAYFDFATTVSRTVSTQPSSTHPNSIQLEDVFQTDEAAWHEIRFISFGEFIQQQAMHWIIRRNEIALHLVFDANQPLHFVVCDAVPSIGVRPMAQMLRVIGKDASLETNITTYLW